jgi:hypothetical protein
MIDLLREATPRLQVSREDLRPHLATGFPWQSPAPTHPKLDTPQKWWDALYPVFARSFAAVGVEPTLACSLAVRVREA